MRPGAAHGERADQDAERHPSPPPEPARHHLQAAGVDPGESDSGEQPQREGQRHVARTETQQAEVETGPGERRQEEEPPGRHDVGERQYGRGDGAGHEADLDCQREPGRLARRELPGVGELRCHRRGGEPQREHEKLAPGDGRQRPSLPGNGRVW